MNANELDDFLKRNKMTGNELAAKLGVHYVTVSRWRNGREPIPKTVELALKWIEGEGRTEQNDNEWGTLRKQRGIKQMIFEQFKNNVEKWAAERGIYEHSTPEAQLLKALSELGEMADAIIKDDREGLKDAIGDVAVCAINYAKMARKQIERPMFDIGESIDSVGLIGELARAIGIILAGETQGELEIQFLLGCLVGICQREGLDFIECCSAAWDEIKDRKGKMVAGGAFVKEEGLV